MLVLKRRIGSRIVLEVNGVKIMLTLTDLTGRHAHIGIEAPPEVKVVREELLERGATPPHGTRGRDG